MGVTLRVRQGGLLKNCFKLPMLLAAFLVGLLVTTQISFAVEIGDVFDGPDGKSCRINYQDQSTYQCYDPDNVPNPLQMYTTSCAYHVQNRNPEGDQHCLSPSVYYWLDRWSGVVIDTPAPPSPYECFVTEDYNLVIRTRTINTQVAYNHALPGSGVMSYDTTIVPAGTPFYSPSSFTIHGWNGVEWIITQIYNYHYMLVGAENEPKNIVDALIPYVGGPSNIYPNGCGDIPSLNPQPEPNQNLGSGRESGNLNNAPITKCPINFATGNKYKKQVDFVPNRPALSMDFVRHYNSQHESATGYGYGWTASFSQHLTFETGKIILHQDDANQVHFIDDTLGSYINEAGKVRTIVPITGGYELTEPDDRKLTFDTIGKLTQIGDRNNNTLTLTYDINNKLQSVADNFGYQIDFAYDVNARLETLITPAGNYNYTYDVNGNLATMTNPALTGKTYLYEDATDVHNLTGIINENGTRIETYSYDAQDRAITSEKAGGINKVTITYNTDLTRIVTDSLGKATTFNLKLASGIAKVESSTGDGCASCVADTNKSFVMDDRMMVTQETDANGVVTNYTYDNRGNILTKTEAVGTPEERTTTYTWHVEYNVPLTIKRPSVSNPGQEAVTAFTYDVNGNRLTKKVDGFSGTTPTSATWTNMYNSEYQLSKVDGPRSEVKDYSQLFYYQVDSSNINDRGQLVDFSEGLIANERFFSSYNAFGKPTKIEKNRIHLISLTYDDLGRVIKKEDTADAQTSLISTQYTYDNVGNLTSIIFNGGKTITYTYTPANLLEKINDNLGNSITYTYDTEGKRIGEDVKDATSVLTKYIDYAYDNQNRLWKLLYPGGTAFDERLYDLEGNLTQFTDANNNITTYDYDALDRLTTTTEPGATVTIMAYDSHDNLVSVTDAENKATTYVYDDFGNVLSETLPDSGTTNYAYDVAGNMISKADANEVAVNYTYDFLNRLTNVSFPDPAQNITYVYELVELTGTNNLARIEDSSGFTAYTYDPFDRLNNQTTTLDGIAYALSYTYDDNGDLSTITYPDGSVITYERDAAGQVTDVTRTVDSVTTSLASGITHMPFGPANTITLGNGLVVSRAFDQQYRLEGSQTGGLYSKTYNYDNVGNITDSNDLLDPAKTELFGYNTLYQLTSATGQYGDIGYSYDKVGNRLTKTKDMESDIYDYEAGTNRLLSIIGTNPLDMSYDAAGNVTARGLRTMVYNDNNRLTQSIEGTKVKGEYTYNGLGQRVKKVAGRTITYYLYDRAGNLMAEMDDAGVIMNEYVYVDGEPLAIIFKPGQRKEATFYYLNDHLTSPKMMTDVSGDLAWQGDREPFGSITVTLEDTTNNFRFPGQYYDAETGLHYNYHRYYDPGTGRYLTPDPIGLAGGINVYAYVQNNPVNFIDPWGLRWQFSQSTGQWSNVNDQTGAVTPAGQGYSGTGDGRNNPNMQDVPFVGPTPQGTYDIGPGHYSPNTGPNTMNLNPRPGTDTFGRDLFRIHGNNESNDASEGCAIAPPNVRRQINNSDDRILEVIP